MQAKEKTLDLNSIQEGLSYDVKENKQGTRQLLKGFIEANVKIHLMSDDITKLKTKQKFNDLFDIGVLSI